jgi:uncharacterized protein (DUF488 family)
MNELFTIGYTGVSPKEFVRALKDAQISLVVDVREIPISRKAGFSKTALCSNLERAGIEYHHFQALGSPMKARHAVRENRNYPKFFTAVRSHLREQDAQESLQAVVQLIKTHQVCLMCCCADWELCHRRCVVEQLRRFKRLSTTHLRAGEPTLAFAS